jgi:hypothetical protein
MKKTVHDSRFTLCALLSAALACGGSENAAPQAVSAGGPAQVAPTAGSGGAQTTVTRTGPAGASGAAPAAPSGGAGAAPSSQPARAAASGASGSAPAAGGAGAPAAAGGAGGAGGTGTPAANSGEMPCDRACLTQLNDDYLKALGMRDATRLPTADDVRFTENGKTLKLTEGLWAVAKSIGDYRQDFAEVPAGQTAGFASLQDDAGTVLLAFRLKVVQRKITEIETTVCRTGQATFFSPTSLKRNPLFDQDLPADKRVSREALTKVVDLYFQGIESSDGSQIPFADSARRNENGTTTGMGQGLQNVAMFSYIDKIDRRYVLVDEERGNVLPWILFQIPMGLGGSRTLHLAEAFKVDGGKIMDIQAIMVNQPLGTPSGWE